MFSARPESLATATEGGDMVVTGQLAARRAREPARRARWAVTSAFFLNGLMIATYFVRVPSLKVEYALSNSQLGMIMTTFGAAAMITMPFMGQVVGRHGSSKVVRTVLILMPAAIASIGFVKGLGFPVFTALAALLGALVGALDVSMNAHAVVVERELGRPILSGCHAALSISAAITSIAAAALIGAGAPLRLHLLGTGMVVIAGGLIIGRMFLPASMDRVQRSGQKFTRNRDEKAAAQKSGGRVSWRTGWSRAVILLGLTGMVLMVCEGAALTWGGVFLHDERGASLGQASYAVTAFTACQTLGRLIGDRLAHRLGSGRAFRTGGLVGAVGLAVAVFSTVPNLAVAGLGVVGLGTSFLIPLTTSAAGHAGGTGPGAAAFVARFSTFTYGGMLLGPAAIGWLAEGITLRWTLTLLLPLLVLVATLARLPETSRALTLAPQLDTPSGA